MDGHVKTHLNVINKRVQMCNTLNVHKPEEMAELFQEANLVFNNF